MINTTKQIEYWIEGAKNDLEAAELLIINEISDGREIS
jgi:hypothetical protein